MQNSQFWQNNFKRTKSCPDTMQWMPFFSRTSSRWRGWRGGRRPCRWPGFTSSPIFRDQKLWRVCRNFAKKLRDNLGRRSTLYFVIFPQKEKTDSIEQGKSLPETAIFRYGDRYARVPELDVSCRPVKPWKGKALAQACGAGILCSTARALT